MFQYHHESTRIIINYCIKLHQVARKGSKYGVPAPLLVQMEEDIDEEIQMEEEEEVYEEEAPPPPRRVVKQRVDQDFKSLDEMVHLYFVYN